MLHQTRHEKSSYSIKHQGEKYTMEANIVNVGDMNWVVNAFTCDLHRFCTTALQISGKSIYYFFFISPNN
jgi:hypothetical protein